MGGVCCRPEVSPLPGFLVSKAETACDLQPIDFDGEVNLFHFVLLRSVGKGAFGKVSDLNSRPSVRTDASRPGPSSTAQADTRTLCPQVHKQGKMCEDEGSRQHHPGTPPPRRGLCPSSTSMHCIPPLNLAYLHFFLRSIILSW